MLLSAVRRAGASVPFPLIVTDAAAAAAVTDEGGGRSHFGSGRKIFDLSRLNVFVSVLPNGSIEIFNVCLLPEESADLEPI